MEEKSLLQGGEPTLVPSRTFAVLNELGKFKDLELIAMYTNGSRLLNESDGKTLTQKLKEEGVQYVNLSVHHYNKDKNNRIFGIDVGDTKLTCKHLNDIGIPFRFCATLQKDGLENTDDILKYLDFAAESGAKDAYLRELFRIYNADTRDDAIRGRLNYIAYNFVHLKPIIDDLQQKGATKVGERTNFQGREKNELAFETKNGFPFFTSQLEIGREKAEELPYLVVKPNAHLYSSWMGPEFIIDSLKEFVQSEGKNG